MGVRILTIYYGWFYFFLSILWIFFVLCFFMTGEIFCVGEMVVVLCVGATGLGLLIGAANDVSVIDPVRIIAVTTVVMIGDRIGK